MKQVGEIVGFGDIPKSLRDKANERGYMARELVQCTLPHKDPGDVEAFTRRDGHLVFGIRAGYDHTQKKRLGLPYGSIPRLLLLWITSEAVRTRDPRLELGNTLSQFLRDVGLDPGTGRGKRGDAKRLKEQMLRLLNAEISFIYESEQTTRVGTAEVDMKVAPTRCLWWDFKQPEQTMLFDSYVILGREFFEAVIANPVPVDVAMAGRLKRSPLALDLFIWVTYRLYRMKEGAEITISYRDLQTQFGAEYGRLRDFKTALKDALQKIAIEYTAIRYDLTDRGLVLHGVAKEALPVREKLNTRLLSNRTQRDPFDLSAADLFKAADHAKGWDIRIMRQEWQQWCKEQGITPEKPLGHFISFLKTHKKRNG
jgi:hypothetical protein